MKNCQKKTLVDRVLFILFNISKGLMAPSNFSKSGLCMNVLYFHNTFTGELKEVVLIGISYKNTI